MKLVRQVFCTLQFSAIHYWPDADNYLKAPHRHLFKVRAQADVSHNDRDIEFIELKDSLDRFVRIRFHDRDLGATSCEDIAEEILQHFGELNIVSVSEDGENGAVLMRREDEIQ